jgi:3-deoxy-D-manno-octulosonic-acid transferase
MAWFWCRTVFTRTLYPLISYLLLPWAVARLIWSGFHNPEYYRRWRERFGIIPTRECSRPLIWIHAVSVGEVQAASPLINRLLDDFPHCQILVTTMTPTGADTVRQRFSQAVDHYYLPYDIPLAVSRFVKRLQPAMLIVLETEIWPNLFRACRRQRVPILLVNARMSERSASGYGRVAQLTRSTLADINLIAAQSRTDADRFLRLGAVPERTRVIGNLKFDISLPPSIHEQAESLRRFLGVNRPVWIAASTHEGEEQQILEAFERILMQHQDCLLLLAPRHPERFERIADLCHRVGDRVARHSRGDPVTAATRVYLVDTLGELPVFYAAADVAFVGGSLVPVGGHNMLEPASLGVPVITGPHCFNFSEVVTILQEAGAAWVVGDGRQLAERLDGLLADPDLRYRAGEYGRAAVESHCGGVEEIIGLLQPYLPACVRSQGGKKRTIRPGLES